MPRERRLRSWKEGDLNELTIEGRTIQQRIPKASSTKTQEHLAHSFAKLMLQGKTKAALRLLTTQTKGGVLRLDDTIDMANHEQRKVRDILIDKHPPGQSAHPDSIIEDEPPTIHPVIFESLDATLIRSAALQTNGAAGPSGLDAIAWRKLCTSFKSTSNDLCRSLASVAKRLCTCLVDPTSIAPILASRLIALDKNPGVRPIGIGDTARCIIAKAILTITRGDIQEAAGSLQLCAGQLSGIEAAVHAVRTLFQRAETEAVLLVDANNAFNSLNRQTALHNIRRLCPPLATILINTYRASTELIVDGDVLYSQEGTTQGDPLAMPMYAIATLPLIKRLNQDSVNQVWYADEATVVGKIATLREWWDQIASEGPMYGYHANATKTWLITKKNHYSAVVAAFADTDVKVTLEGRPHLGAALGTQEYIELHMRGKVQEWSRELECLATIAHTQPHAAHAAFTHGMTSKWSYLTRTIPNISHLFQPLEDTIRTQLAPALTGRPPPNDAERDLLALPARLGGIALLNPTKDTDTIFRASVKITEPLKVAILQQNPSYTHDIVADQLKAKAEIHKLKRQQSTLAANHLKQVLPNPFKSAMDLAEEKGAFSWLTSLPIEEFGFALHKGAFHDALALRYDWQPSRCPSNCACGTKFTVDHALSCPKGGFPSIRHNEIRDLTANLLTEICHDVCIEPDLQPITGEVLTCATSNTQDGARLDIAANGFWGGRFERAYFDVRVFNPHAPSNRQTRMPACYRKHESVKKRAYEQRVREVEHGLLHTTGTLCHWWFSQRGNHFLQKTPLPPSY